MVEQDGGQRWDVFKQGVDRALGQSVEGVVGRREDGERSLALQRPDEICSLERGDERLEAVVGDGDVDDRARRLCLRLLLRLLLRLVLRLSVLGRLFGGGLLNLLLGLRLLVVRTGDRQYGQQPDEGDTSGFHHHSGRPTHSQTACPS